MAKVAKVTTVEMELGTMCLWMTRFELPPMARTAATDPKICVSTLNG